MRYGAMNFPVAPVVLEIEAFARLGFDYLELAMDPPMAHHSVLSASKREIVRALKDSGLGLVCHLPTFVSTADLTESIRLASATEMLRSLEVAADLGAEKAVLHPSMVGGMGGYVMETIKAYAFEFFGGLIAAARKFDIIICLENMLPRNILATEPHDFPEIFAAFPELKLTLDTGHANIDDRTGERLEIFVEQFSSRIGHLHFSDNKGRWDEHLAVGKGTVDFTKLVRSLKAIGYDDTLTLEVFESDRRKLVASRERIESLFARS